MSDSNTSHNKYTLLNFVKPQDTWSCIVGAYLGVTGATLYNYTFNDSQTGFVESCRGYVRRVLWPVDVPITIYNKIFGKCDHKQPKPFLANQESQATSFTQTQSNQVNTARTGHFDESHTRTNVESNMCAPPMNPPLNGNSTMSPESMAASPVQRDELKGWGEKWTQPQTGNTGTSQVGRTRQQEIDSLLS
jgi:hypothetical protein